jgi:hypothetical protein
VEGGAEGLTAVDRKIVASVIETLFAYGKLGLLIEDAADARLRTARELYAADGLPAWWLHYDNLQEGTQALGAVWSAVVEGRPAWAHHLPVLVVLDRYVKEAPGSSRAVAWDEGEPSKRVDAGLEMERSVRGIAERGATTSIMLELVTSYSGPSSSSGRSGFSWQLRHHEPLYQLRRRLHAEVRDAAPLEQLQSGPAPIPRLPEPARFKQLLYYGPTPGAPVQDRAREPIFARDEDRRAALCRARYWHSCVGNVAEALARVNQRVACILLTGAGASLANDPLAPGIPPTWFLLERACWQATAGRAENKPVWPAERLRQGGAGPPRKVNSLRELLDCYEDGQSALDLEWTLEELFKGGQPYDPRFADFASAFRQALHAWDHDFPYHHWLLCQLPWTLILTTNFDRFHENAAASAAALALPKKVDLVRRLGDAIPLADQPASPGGLEQAAREEKRDPSAVSFSSLRGGPGLLKPYGSLMKIGELTLAHDDFWRRLEVVSRDYLRPVLADCDVCWLVIVGHHLASDALHHCVRELRDYEQKLHLVWVEPRPYANNLDGFHAFRHFRDTLNDNTTPEAVEGQPRWSVLPARALDFAFDLWLAAR